MLAVARIAATLRRFIARPARAGVRGDTDVEIDQVQLLLDRRGTLCWDSRRGQDRADRRSDALPLIALPVVLGPPHIEVSKASIDLRDQVQQLTVRGSSPIRSLTR